ncbi:hypothetical protein NTHI1209_01297 [Haemophilus influenzae]|uniref:Uncharacterized protein n=1 Tax=Haemophilus influenzae TaxID=727 RepID=A0A158SXU5_HAEIF|nr:hypothetical protein NTHI1209_01297 [Haemophilus influenzae]
MNFQVGVFLCLAFSQSRIPCTTQGNSQWLNIIYFQANQKTSI